jgi:hypothetical protein
MWWTLAENPGAITSLYSQPPELTGVEVHAVRLHRDGAAVELVVEMPLFPDRPLPRWNREDNSVQATLRFDGSRDATLQGWGTSNVGELRIDRAADGRVRYRFESPAARIAGAADAFRVTGVEAYVDAAKQVEGGPH